LLVEYTRRKGINSEGLAILPPGGGWLLAEFGAHTISEAESRARQVMQVLAGGAAAPQMRLFTDKQQAKRVWEVRESALGATSHVPGEPLDWEGWEDAAVAPEKLGSYLRDLTKLMSGFGYRSSMYGHFGHACVHMRINFDLQTAGGIANYRKFVEEAADLVVGYGGSLSGEHGDGHSRAELLPKMFGPELVQAFREFKAIWDPQWKMNPGKVVEPYKLDEHLRLGIDYHPWEPAMHFKFPADDGSLAGSTLRCVGVGKCRRYDGGVMCPSFRVTREEEHSTRGRAHLLWEMTKGDVIRDGWRSEQVKESLDLCLSCKGCKSDCPVGVDVATYKSEFLSHYYEGKPRPVSAYAFGHIARWARLASFAPWLANLPMQAPLLRNLTKLGAGIAPERTLPALAGETFRAWFNRRPCKNPDKPRILLWPDTFNNYFLPETAKAAVEVIEDAGFRVVLPKRSLCCGRPLYDWGMLAAAKRNLQEIMQSLTLEGDAGSPIVVLEPSCAVRYAGDVKLPKLHRRALLHGHCHHKSIMKMTDEETILRAMEIDLHAPAPGCCGMAGAFGFERDKYSISMAIGELELFPALRSAGAEELIIADGFSCREQIRQASGRPTLHLAEVLRSDLSDRL